MAKKKVKKATVRDWIQSDASDGIIEISCKGWPSFENFIHETMGNLPDYIWRGQRCSDWPLRSSLDRRLRTSYPADPSEISRRKRFLDRFKIASRGRHTVGTALPKDDDEWWALGQHYGLATPLLDWTASPFIGAYFAFADVTEPQTAHRILYGLSVRLVYQKSLKFKADERIQFISPLVDDNPRLLHQRGLFTKAPSGLDVESWVRQHFQGRNDKWILIKILIEERARNSFLRSLERMAVSSLELFPDLTGASQYCNLGLEVDNYYQNLVDLDI